MTTTTCAERLARARKQLADQSLDALLVGPSPDFRYLTGYLPPALERLTMLVVPAQGEVRLVVPALEAPLAHDQLGDLDVEVVSWRETDDPVALVRSALEAAGPSGATAPARLAVGDQLWSSFLLRLQAALPRAEFSLASAVTRRLRMVKDDAEVEALARVAAAIDQVVSGLPELRWAGRTEREIARELDRRIREVHDDTLFVIVGAGPGSASPHHEPGDRVIRPGDAVVVDIGGSLDGYCSDTTRTLVVGEPPAGFLELYEVLRAAQEAGCAAVRAGVPAETVDAACRDIITAAGYGERFLHRTGHGIGLEVHEEPYIVAGNGEPLAPGMAFSVEPGIYLAGRHGARIEDIVVCPPGDPGGAQGARRLNRTSRDLLVVPG